MTIGKNELLMILCDAREYHLYCNSIRLSKNYKRKAKKESNERLIIFHKKLINELDTLIKQVENNEQIEIIED